LLIAVTAERERLVILCDHRDYLGIAARPVTGQPVKIITETWSNGTDSFRQAARST
jgi:hypothetical protein